MFLVLFYSILVKIMDFKVEYVPSFSKNISKPRYIPLYGNSFKEKSDGVQTSDAFWRSARVLVSDLSFKWFSPMFLQ